MTVIESTTEPKRSLFGFLLSLTVLIGIFVLVVLGVAYSLGITIGEESPNHYRSDWFYMVRETPEGFKVVEPYSEEKDCHYFADALHLMCWTGAQMSTRVQQEQQSRLQKSAP